MKGLSIHYTMTTPLSDTVAVRTLVADMRRLAIGLSFEKVGPVVEIVRPLPLLCFPFCPGNGCEVTAFGFCKLPLSERWQWSYSCCTQPASRPEHGGLDNFLRCHRAIIDLLEAIKLSGLAGIEVKDDSGYWERRDPTKLAEAVQAWNGVDLIFPEDE